MLVINTVVIVFILLLINGELLARTVFDEMKGTISEVGVDSLYTGSQSVRIDHGVVTIDFNCAYGGFNYVEFSTVSDSGNRPKLFSRRIDPLVDSHIGCSSRNVPISYKGTSYVSSEGVRQNLWDHAPRIMKKLTYSTNFVPMNKTQSTTGLNRALEKRLECARDIVGVNVWVGVIWREGKQYDTLKKEYSVKIPAIIWRIHQYDNGAAFTWAFPNTDVASIELEQQYRITLSELKDTIDDTYQLSLPDDMRDALGQDPYQQITCSTR